MSAMSASPELVTAAVLVIGDEILSGRTKDKNIGFIADYLTAIGIDLKEVRVISDDETAIVDALNALRKTYTYVFTTGGIGPTHDDITAECVAKAFGVGISHHPEAVAILKERMAKIGGELNEARLRMARIPHGAALVKNKVSGAPGFWIENVIVMAGVPSIMQAMVDEVAPKLKTGAKLLSETIRADAKEGDVGTELGAIAKANPDHHRQLSVLRRDARTEHQYRGAVARSAKIAGRQRRGRGDAQDGEGAAGRGRALTFMPKPPASPLSPEKIFPVSWDQFHRDSRALAWRLHAAGPFDAVVAITRGGLVPAAIVARELNVRLIETVCVASYQNYKNEGELKVIKGVGPEVTSMRAQGKGVLIVDDLVDTGKTARIVRDMLPAAHFATVYAKPMGRPLVDTFITEVSQDTWIYFPWDTGLAFQPPIREGGE